MIEAKLASPDDRAGGVDALVVPTPLERIAQFVLPPFVPAAVAIPQEAAPTVAAGNRMQGGILVEPRLLQDTDRLGDLMTRQVTEFPVELDHPVRLRSKIIAQYPPAALAAGREGSVAVWILVDANGNPEEIEISDGSEEFANAVRAALQGAYFLPAQNNRLFIRYPISLEFSFSAAKPADSLPDAARPAATAQPN